MKMNGDSEIEDELKIDGVDAGRVLIVDGDPITVGLLELHLQKAGVNVMGVNCAIDAIHVIDSFNPDLIILNMVLPDMDGWEAFQRFRTITFAPVVMLAADATQKDVTQALMQGVDDFIIRPFHSAELIARIGAMLRRMGRKTPFKYLASQEDEDFLEQIMI